MIADDRTDTPLPEAVVSGKSRCLSSVQSRAVSALRLKTGIDYLQGLEEACSLAGRRDPTNGHRDAENAVLDT